MLRRNDTALSFALWLLTCLPGCVSPGSNGVPIISFGDQKLCWNHSIPNMTGGYQCLSDEQWQVVQAQQEQARQALARQQQAESDQRQAAAAAAQAQTQAGATGTYEQSVSASIYQQTVQQCYQHPTISSNFAAGDPGECLRRAKQEYDSEIDLQREGEKRRLAGEAYWARPHYANGMQLASPVPVQVAADDPLLANGWLNGALACQNLDALKLASHMLSQVQMGRLVRAHGLEYYYSESGLSTDGVLEATGCRVIPSGSPVQVVQRGVLPVIRWNTLQGITYPQMLK
jgi:hypothetical protein